MPTRGSRTKRRSGAASHTPSSSVEVCICVCVFACLRACLPVTDRSVIGIYYHSQLPYHTLPYLTLPTIPNDRNQPGTCTPSSLMIPVVLYISPVYITYKKEIGNSEPTDRPQVPVGTLLTPWNRSLLQS